MCSGFESTFSILLHHSKCPLVAVKFFLMAIEPKGKLVYSLERVECFEMEESPTLNENSSDILPCSCVEGSPDWKTVCVKTHSLPLNTYQ